MAEKIARITRITWLTPEVLEVDAAMRTPADVKYRAGQFVSVRFPSAAPSAERRSYSIASNATRTDGFELLVKLIPGGLASTWFAAAAVGDELHFTGPMGFFVPDLAHPGDVLFAVTGSGIAAAVPMLHDILSRPPAQEHGKVVLYWGLRHEDERYWLDRIAALERLSPRFTWHLSLSRPRPDWTGPRGRITEHVLAAAPRAERPVCYLVGNGDMVRDVKTGLLALGLDRKKQVRVEVFYPAASPVK